MKNDFKEMLRTVINESETTHAKFAAALGISPQYMSDLINGKRRPNPRLVDRICDYLGRGPRGRFAWHWAGATACGWKV